MPPFTLLEAVRRSLLRAGGAGAAKSSPASSSLVPWREELAAVAALEPELRRLGEEPLRERARTLRRRSLDGVAPAELLSETLALVREASRRSLGLRPYDEQIAAGIALHRGQLVQMQTGEGKTLAAVGPVCLEAFLARGVHVLTFNDYLARRDAEWMGPIYRRLGLEVGCIQEGMDTAERKAAYARDVTYLTAKEAGFDLLRDQLCLDRDEQVHRPFHMALVDEADSILIDEARIPLVVSGAIEESKVGVEDLADLARSLRPGIDFDTDEYARNISLTPEGSERAESSLGCGHLYEAENAFLLAEIRNALHAEHLLRRDVDYIVRQGEVELVDELTGRVAENRLWPDGLQAAVEAKEGLHVRPEGRILGSITLQHLLLSYPRLCGMTATARVAGDEMRERYGLEMVDIPTHEPGIRIDDEDRIFVTREARTKAVIEEIRRAHERRRPVLVGTLSVEESERLAHRLEREGIPHRVLNARNDEAEAAVVAEAGAPGAVTISTNMAGRGTDIRLGGKNETFRDEVVAAGGLYVIGTNRHESRRIDDQLRGRAGRQGDPGGSRFFVSLEDPLLERYGIEKLIPGKLLVDEEDGSIDNPLVRREVARVQRIVEGQNFDIRRRLVEYSDILDKQRMFVQEWRQGVLEGEAPLELLAERAPLRYAEVETMLHGDLLRGIAQRLALHAIDRSWSEHLETMQALRDEIHLVMLDGRLPLAEFYRQAAATFEELVARIDERTVELFESLPITARGVDWERAGLRRPTATWTYLVSDAVYQQNLLHGLSTRASIGVWGVLLLWPLLLVWGLYQHLLRRRRRRE